MTNVLTNFQICYLETVDCLRHNTVRLAIIHRRVNRRHEQYVDDGRPGVRAGSGILSWTSIADDEHASRGIP